MGFVPKVCDTGNTYLLKKVRDPRPTQRYDFCVLRSSATETVASDVSVGHSRTWAKQPFFGRSMNLMAITDIRNNV
jgi:hypothetical protein